MPPVATAAASRPTFDPAPMARDFTPGGLKLEGQYENDRNISYHQLYKDILREVYGPRMPPTQDVIIGHHLTYVIVEKREGFDYQIVQEIPSADALIFDHEVAQCIWGDAWASRLTLLALEPPASRDKLLAELYYGRLLRPRRASAP